MQLVYPDQTTVKLTLRPDPSTQKSLVSRPLFSRTASGVSTSGTMRIADLQIGEQRIALNPNNRSAIPASSPTRVETAKPAFPSPFPAKPAPPQEETLPTIDATGSGWRTSAMEK